MLKISPQSISDQFDCSKTESMKILRMRNNKNIPKYVVISIVLMLFILMFFPWTQNIQAKGKVTTYLPEQKPQAIQSIISGKIEKWYVREGDFVNKGDTILFISEVKSEYLDPELVQRTAEQMEAKKASVLSYDEKVKSLQNQYLALAEAKKLKVQQTYNKINQSKLKLQSDSLDMVALKTNENIARNQLLRIKELYDKGLKTLSDLQDKEMKLQETIAKTSVQENKILTIKSELTNLKIELNAIESDYNDKLAKSQSDKFSALSDKLDVSASASKLQNQLSNYTARRDMYFITAPQAGYVTKTIQTGIGEILKDGDDILTIVPEKYDLAVEIYVKPQDISLIRLNNVARLRFDGWPTIIVSGWPKASTGIFTGHVFAIDQNISSNGLYRILVKPDATDRPWPERLMIGTAADAFLLFEDVTVWYELWRQLNGFPPNYYNKDEGQNENEKRKNPIKFIK